MGVRIEFEFQDEQFRAALTRMTITPARRQVLQRAIGQGLLHTTLDRFRSQTTPVGSHWQALNPGYLASRRYSGSPILTQSGMRGGLSGSLTVQTPGNLVIVGSNKVYAAVHQFGAVITPKGAKALVFKIGGRFVRAKRVVIPPRPYLGFGRADQRAVLDVIDVLLPGGR